MAPKPLLYKKSVLRLLLCSFGLMYVTVDSREARTKKHFMPAKPIKLPITPENTILAFDIHAVLVDKKTGDMAFNLFKNAGALTYINHPEVKKHFKELNLATAAPEDLFMPLAEKIPGFEAYVPGFLKIVNAQKIMPGIKTILAKLSTKGYQLNILSNIGHSAFYGWQSPNNPQFSAIGLKDIYPDIFKQFTHVQVASRKPSAQAYTGFAKQYGTNPHPKNIIFIDDKWENVQAAVKEGFIGIWFTSAHQLETELMRLGVL